MKTFQLAILLSLLISCAQTDVQNQKDWTQSMQGMANSLKNLFPYAYDEKKFRDKKSQLFVKSQLAKLANHATSLSQATGKQLSGSDPFFKLGLVGLRRTTGKALKTYEVGSYDYSQLLVQSTLHYCFNCHSRTNEGPSLVLWDQFTLPENTNLPTKIRALVSSRQFIKAGQVAEKYLFTGRFEKEWELKKALKMRLIIALRQHEDPTEALAVLGRLKKSRHSAKFSKESRNLISAWRTSLRHWEKHNKTGRYLTLEQILNKPPYIGSNPEHNFINYIRESTVLHKGLREVKTPRDRAKAYLHLGLIYMKIHDLGFWELPEYYFEACIRAYPASDLSKRCYYNLEEKVSLDNAKGAEIVIPRREKDYLRKLFLMTEKRKYPMGFEGS